VRNPAPGADFSSPAEGAALGSPGWEGMDSDEFTDAEEEGAGMQACARSALAEIAGGETLLLRSKLPTP